MSRTLNRSSSESDEDTTNQTNGVLAENTKRNWQEASIMKKMILAVVVCFFTICVCSGTAIGSSHSPGEVSVRDAQNVLAMEKAGKICNPSQLINNDHDRDSKKVIDEACLIDFVRVAKESLAFDAVIETLSKATEAYPTGSKENIWVHVQLADAYIRSKACKDGSNDRICQKPLPDFENAVSIMGKVEPVLRSMKQDDDLVCQAHLTMGLANWLSAIHPKLKKQPNWEQRKNEHINNARHAFNAAALCKSVSQYADYWSAQILAYDRKYDQMLKKLDSARKGNDAAFTAKMDEVIKKWQSDLNPWHANATIGVQYDSNVVAKPSESIPGLNVSNKSDISTVVNATARYQPHFDSGFILAAQVDLYSQVYSKLHRYDTIGATAGVSVGHEIVRDKLNAYVQTSYSYFWMDGKNYMSLLTVKPTLDYMFWREENGRSSLKAQAGVGFWKRNMMNEIYSADENRDADIFSVFGGLMYTFANGDGSLGLHAETADERTKGVNWANNWTRVSLDGVVPFSLLFDGEFASRLALIFGADYMEQHYKNIHTVFDVKRKDRISSGSLGLAYKFSKSVIARLLYTRVHNWSNIPLYKYDRNIVYFGLSFGF